MRFQHAHADQARELNQIVDRALTDPSELNREAICALVSRYNVYHLAERARRRATLLTRHKRKNSQNLLRHRDALIMTLYAQTTPSGWANVWCDGSSVTHNNVRKAGIGVIVFSHSGHCLSQVSLGLGNKTAFEAEVQAIVHALHICKTHNINWVRIYTDNKGLAQLWREHRQDSRLTIIREQAMNLERLQIRAIPRLHNQAANALAKRATVSNRQE